MNTFATLAKQAETLARSRYDALRVLKAAKAASTEEATILAELVDNQERAIRKIAQLVMVRKDSILRTIEQTELFLA